MWDFMVMMWLVVILPWSVLIGLVWLYTPPADPFGGRGWPVTDFNELRLYNDSYDDCMPKDWEKI